MTNSIFFVKEGLKNLLCSRNILLISCFLVLTGCAQYQYVFIDSHLLKNDKKEFIKENDTVKIKYSFFGENFPVTLTISNKLQQPLYIDWDRSVAVINDVQVDSPFNNEGQVGFIAPLSSVTISGNSLRSQFIELNPNDPRIKVEMTGGSMKGVKYSYDENSTPLFFRTVLALTTNENLSIPTFYDYSFWVSDIVESASAPNSVTYNPPNKFFIKKESRSGKIFGWTVLLATSLILGGLTSGQ
jgi:hypothetical protein